MSSPISSGNITNSMPKLSSPAVRDAGPSSEKGSVNGESQGLSNPTVTRDSVAIKQGESSLLDLKGFRHVGDDIGFNPTGWAMDTDGLLVGDTPEFGALLNEPEIAVDDFDPDTLVPEIAVDDFDAIRTDAITGMYQEILGRDPEPEGLQFWFDSDFSLDEIKERIADSPERRTNAITEMYQEILGRDPEPEGLQYWFDSGLSLDEVREGIANSPEALALGERGPEEPESREQAITSLYRELLGYDPEPEDLKLWAESDFTVDEIRAIITKSLEAEEPDVGELVRPDVSGLLRSNRQ